jgi:HSP20 family molecular chaperone IbpA
MPGVEKDNINVNVPTLYCGNYSRSFRLSSAIDQNKIGAELRDGVLALTLPKVEEAKPRTIQIR